MSSHGASAASPLHCFLCLKAYVNNVEGSPAFSVVAPLPQNTLTSHTDNSIADVLDSSGVDTKGACLARPILILREWTNVKPSIAAGVLVDSLASTCRKRLRQRAERRKRLRLSRQVRTRSIVPSVVAMSAPFDTMHACIRPSMCRAWPFQTRLL